MYNKYNRNWDCLMYNMYSSNYNCFLHVNLLYSIFLSDLYILSSSTSCIGAGGTILSERVSFVCIKYKR